MKGTVGPAHSSKQGLYVPAGVCGALTAWLCHSYSAYHVFNGKWSAKIKYGGLITAVEERCLFEWKRTFQMFFYCIISLRLGGALGCFQTPVCSTWQKKIKSTLEHSHSVGFKQHFTIGVVLSASSELRNFQKFSDNCLLDLVPSSGEMGDRRWLKMAGLRLYSDLLNISNS